MKREREREEFYPFNAECGLNLPSTYSMHFSTCAQISTDIYLNHLNAHSCNIQILFIAGTKPLYNRYKIDVDGQCGKTYVLAWRLLFSLGLDF